MQTVNAREQKRLAPVGLSGGSIPFNAGEATLPTHKTPPGDEIQARA